MILCVVDWLVMKVTGTHPRTLDNLHRSVPMTAYRKAFVAAVAAIGIIIAGQAPGIGGLAEAIAAVGAFAVYWIPNAPGEQE